MKVPQEKCKISSSKNSDCQATISIKVKLNKKSTRKSDSFIKRGLVAVITLNDLHNHSLNTAEALKFLPSIDSKEKFMEYFNDGLGIIQSCKYHEGILQLKEEFTEEDMANSRINPSYRTVQYWYDQWRLLNLGPRTGQGVIEKLKDKSKAYEENGITVRLNEEPFAVAIVTPIMKRAHGLKSSSEIVFVDSTSSCDPDNHSITFMLCPCSAGAVPLAVIITKGQTEEVYKTGFHLLHTALEKPFYGVGYPSIFMTDDSEAEIKALRHVWPLSRNLLCIFHVAQAVWRWLWDSKHGIPKEHRNLLMMFFEHILYAKTFIEAEEAYINSCGYIGSYLPTYANWNEYVRNWWKTKEMWCLAFRNENVRGHNSKNFSEVCIRIFKDEVLCRVKAYNVLTILDFISTHLEMHYVKKFRDFANSRSATSRLFLLSLKKKALTITKNDIEMHDTDIFSVKSGMDTYYVNVKAGCCSCSVGLYGRFCKHQYSVFQHYNIVSRNFPPVLPEDRHEISLLALGDKAPPKEFFEPLVSKAHVIQKKQDIPTEEEILIHNCEEGETQTYEEKRQNLIKEIFEEITKKDEIYKSSLNGLNTFLKRLKSIKSTGTWETFLHTAGNCMHFRRRSGSAIRVQPTSIARRSAQVTRGSKRLPGGRSASVPPKKKEKAFLIT
ncbi:uncharacterized protein [Parasteatoda tepidariorum]|uniref:uncharacterized protein n=1 Tax=Parasteatoda tepidariorum TaxID=114398 RepID=UPI001C7186DD|nr:uncharacterized protein LOC122273266 [Parasteatoda tepidariorum]